MSNWIRRCVAGGRRGRRPRRDISGPMGPVYHEGWRSQAEINMGEDPGIGAGMIDLNAGGNLMELRGIGPVERDLINFNRDMAIAAQRRPRAAPPSPGALATATVHPGDLAIRRQAAQQMMLGGHMDQQLAEEEAAQEAAVQAAEEAAELAACREPAEPYVFSPPPPGIRIEQRHRYTGRLPGSPPPSPHLRPIPYEADEWDPNCLDETFTSFGTSFMGSSECLATPLPFSPYGDDEYINEEDECTCL